MTQPTKRILSGIQPTGHIHLGNYLGAIKTWIPLVESSSYECFFFAADLHALTLPQSPEALRHSVYFTIASYIASGVNPDKAILFPQSLVRAHSELMWLLSCNTPLGWLYRMTQFKDKAGKNKDNAGLGLLAYPVLMAADILLYNADFVPVGEDQKQHLEIARDIAQSLNHHYPLALLKQPEPLIRSHAARIMSLRDGTKKMSKSDPSEFSRIHIDDSNEDIAAKIRKAKSDAYPFPASAEEAVDRPEATNFAQIMSALTDETLPSVYSRWAEKPFSQVKTELTEAIISSIGPIRDEIQKLLGERGYLDTLIQRSAEKASIVADATLLSVQKALGLR